MQKKYLSGAIILCFAFLVCTASVEAATTSDSCSTSTSALEAAKKAVATAAETAYSLPDPDDSFFENCIGNLLDGGLGFGLSTFSLDSLINKACSTARSSISSTLNSYNSSYSIDYGSLGASASGTLTNGGSGISVSDTSSSLYNDIWSAIQ